MKEQIYLDYNVLQKVVCENIDICKSDKDYYISVAHMEEYEKALKNDNGDNREFLEYFKENINKLCEGRILFPGIEHIEVKINRIDDARNNIAKYDTTETIKENATLIEKIEKSNIQSIQTDSNAKNFSNLSCADIWERVEVKKLLETSKERYQEYRRTSPGILSKCYGAKNAKLLESIIVLPETFDYTVNKDVKAWSYQMLEFAIEDLNFVLCNCGYWRDKGQRKKISGIHDVSHMIYATYCTKLVSNDERFRKRSQAIYSYLGLDIKVIDLEEFLKTISIS